MATEIWQIQGGTANRDKLNAAMMGSDGSTILAGYDNLNTTAVTTVWTAMKLDADGDVIWKWQDEIKGDDGDFLLGAAMGQNGSVALAGIASSQFKVIKLDSDGNFAWRFEDTSGSSDQADGIAMLDDGSVMVAGSTFGDWDIPNIGGWDLVAFKLDANGNLVWKWQDGTVGDDFGRNLAMADDGSIVIAGESSGDFAGIEATDVESEFNFAAIKLDSEGGEVWRWQGGPRGETNGLKAASMTEDGCYVLAGYTEGVWSGVASAGGQDFAAVKLDADGNEVWRWQNGTSGDDRLLAATMQDDGTIVLGGSTEGNFDGVNAGGTDFALIALDHDGEEIWRWQGGSASSVDLDGSDFIDGISAGSDGRVVFAGITFGSWVASYVGAGDYVAAMLNTSALATASTTTPSPSATASSPSPSSTAPPPSATTPNPSPSPTTLPPSPSGQFPSPAFTTAPPSADVASLTPFTMPPTLPGTTPTSLDQTVIMAGVASAVAGFVLIALCCWFRKRHIASNNRTSTMGPSLPVVADNGNIPPHHRHNVPPTPPPPSYEQMVAAAEAERIGRGGGTPMPLPGTFDGGVAPAVKPTTGGAKVGGASGGSLVQRVSQVVVNPQSDLGGGESGGSVEIRQEDAGDASLRRDLTVTTSTGTISTGERDEFARSHEKSGVAGAAFVGDTRMPALDANRDASSNRPRGSSDGLLLGHAVGAAAQELAFNCNIPGVSEAAAAVSILVNLLTDNRQSKNGTDASLRRCRSIVLMLKRAAKVLGKGGDTTGKAERAMMEDVHDAIFDLVELIKTYQSKNKLSQVLASTLFRRRQDEMGAVVDRAILGLQLGLHVQVGNDVSAVKHDVGAFKDGMHLYQGSIEEAHSKYLVEGRRKRRQRKLDKIEIPEDHVAITEELLGKGGFGEVFLADYNGRNAAAKVLYIAHDISRRGDNDVLDGSTSGQLKQRRQKEQRNAFLRELDSMTRLRSPYTVNVYGAITCLPDRLVLVMELLAGGDLRTLLTTCEHPLAQQQARQIVGDICAGMVFLHSKQAIHGDVKSANVLLNGAGRAKIGDFGTSRWTHHTMSTGLATFTTKSSKNTQMSLAWSAPEVLHAGGSTYASDVYSFGIVVWEVLSRELPWETLTHPRDIYIRVVLNDLRPTIPDDAPAEIADVAKACWVSEPGDRPAFSAILEGMKDHGWNE